MRSQLPGPGSYSPLLCNIMPGEGNFRKDAAPGHITSAVGKDKHPQLVPGNPFMGTHRGVSSR